MARNQESIELSTEQYTELTNADVTNISFQTLAGIMEVRYTVGSVQPATNLRGARYTAESGEQQKALATLTFLAGANRVWAIAKGQTKVTVWVDHA